MLEELKLRFVYLLVHLCEKTPSLRDVSQINSSKKKLTGNLNNFNCNLMSNVWATMPCVQLSHNMLVNCIDNRQNQLFSEMSLRDVMELPLGVLRGELYLAYIYVHSQTNPQNCTKFGSNWSSRLTASQDF